MPGSLTECKKQSDRKQVDSDEGVKVPAVKGKKIAITITNTSSFSLNNKRGDGKV